MARCGKRKEFAPLGAGRCRRTRTRNRCVARPRCHHAGCRSLTLAAWWQSVPVGGAKKSGWGDMDTPAEGAAAAPPRGRRRQVEEEEVTESKRLGM